MNYCSCNIIEAVSNCKSQQAVCLSPCEILANSLRYYFKDEIRIFKKGGVYEKAFGWNSDGK